MSNFSSQHYTTLNMFFTNSYLHSNPLHPPIETKSTQPYSSTQGRLSFSNDHHYIKIKLTEGARWSSGIDAAIGACGRGSRPVYYLTVQRPWTSH